MWPQITPATSLGFGVFPAQLEVASSAAGSGPGHGPECNVEPRLQVGEMGGEGPGDWGLLAHLVPSLTDLLTGQCCPEA